MHNNFFYCLSENRISLFYEKQPVNALQETHTMCGQSADSLILRLVVHIVTNGLQGNKAESKHDSLADFHPSLNWIFKN
jgi:hypothetical protein